VSPADGAAVVAPGSTGPPLRALVTDVDGTLTDHDRRLEPTTIDAVHALRARGWPVVLATGNVLPIALALHRTLGLDGPIVAENGGILYRGPPGHETVIRLTDQAPALAAYRRLRAAGLPVRRLFTDRWREAEVALYPTVALGRIRAALDGFPITVESTGYAIHLMAPGGGKLPALERALEELDLGLDACVVLGDGDNDVAMLRRAGWAVSFPNGSARARRAADFVTRASCGRGFVEALKHLGVYEPPSTAGRGLDARRNLRAVR